MHETNKPSAEPIGFRIRGLHSFLLYDFSGDPIRQGFLITEGFVGATIRCNASKNLPGRPTEQLG